MIPNMAIEIDGVEFITTAEAAELARELGEKVSRSAITQAANRWVENQSETGIEGARRLGAKKTSSWILPKPSFLTWLENKRDW